MALTNHCIHEEVREQIKFQSTINLLFSRLLPTCTNVRIKPVKTIILCLVLRG